MADLAFIDTNILLYSLSFLPAEKEKQRIAQAILDRGGCALSVQVLHEFMHQATRRSGSLGLSVEEAVIFVQGWRRFPTQENTLAILDAGIEVKARTGYSIWDSLIVAAARALGCTILYTEDMQDGRIVDGLRVINPFREGASLPWE